MLLPQWKNNPIIPLLCLILVKQSPRGVLEFLADVKVPDREDSGKQEGTVSRDYWRQTSNTTSAFCFECERPKSSESLGPVMKPLRHHTFKLSRTKRNKIQSICTLNERKKSNKKEKLMKKISHDALAKPSWESCIITPDSPNLSVQLETMNTCSHCHFLLFKIYWSCFFKASPFIYPSGYLKTWGSHLVACVPNENPSPGHKIAALWALSLEQMTQDKKELTKSILVVYESQTVSFSYNQTKIKGGHP